MVSFFLWLFFLNVLEFQKYIVVKSQKRILVHKPFITLTKMNVYIIMFYRHFCIDTVMHILKESQRIKRNILKQYSERMLDQK